MSYDHETLSGFFSSFDMLKLEGVSNLDRRALRSSDDL